MKGSRIVFDGFTGFTPNQCEVIGGLLRTASCVTVTLPLGSGLRIEQVSGSGHIFSRSRYTYDQLLRLAGEAGVPVHAPVYTGAEGLPRFLAAPALSRLEGRFGRYRTDGNSPLSSNGSVILTEAASPAEEAESVACGIRKAVRDEGYRWRDIAVVCSDLSIYRRHIERAFDMCEIPCFIDAARTLDQNPFGSYVIGLTGPSEENFSHDSIFRLLKSRFSGVSKEDCDILENHALARGIRGAGSWKKTWYDEECPRIDEIRLSAVSPYLSLSEKISGKKHTVSQITQALLGFLEESGCEEKLRSLSDELDSAGEFSPAMEFSSIWDLTKDLFTRIESILGDEQATAEEVRYLIEAGFAEMKAGVIPAGTDTVIVGDISRSRIGDIRRLYFVGFNDGLVPSDLSDSSILSEIERDHLRAAGVELRPGPREDSYLQKLRVYQTLTRPREGIIISYSRTGDDSKARHPSPWLKEIQNIFGGLEVVDAGDLISSEGTAASLLAARLSLARSMRYLPENGDPDRLYAWFLRNEAEGGFVISMARARTFRYEGDRLGTETVRDLFGGRLYGSASSFERYASCPFSWFAQFGLGLKERKVYGVDRRDMGTILHGAIENYFIHMQKEGFGWTQTDDERCDTVRACVEEALSKYGYSIFSETHRDAGLAIRLTRAADRAVWALVEQGKRGDYLPEDTEVAFSAADTDAFNIALQDGWTLRLRGRIDRLDTFREFGDKEKLMLKVVDYKSGNKELDPALIQSGLEIQLPMYLYAAAEMEGKKHPRADVIPGGIGYFAIARDFWLDDPEVYASDPDRLEEDMLARMNMSALINSEEGVVIHMDRALADGRDSSALGLKFKKNGLAPDRSAKVHLTNTEQLRDLMRFSRDRAAGSGREIVSGKVDAHPYSYAGREACRYCLYGSVCGFTPKAGYTWNHIRQISDEDFWESI